MLGVVVRIHVGTCSAASVAATVSVPRFGTTGVIQTIVEVGLRGRMIVPITASGQITGACLVIHAKG